MNFPRLRLHRLHRESPKQSRIETGPASEKGAASADLPGAAPLNECRLCHESTNTPCSYCGGCLDCCREYAPPGQLWCNHCPTCFMHLDDCRGEHDRGA
jgi:hypothetical protein